MRAPSLTVLFILLASNFNVSAQVRSDKELLLLLTQASDCFEAGQYDAAAHFDVEVLKQDVIAADIKSAALLLLGNIGIAKGNLDFALSTYSKLLDMSDAPLRDKELARTGIIVIQSLKQRSQTLL